MIYHNKCIRILFFLQFLMYFSDSGLMENLSSFVNLTKNICLNQHRDMSAFLHVNTTKSATEKKNHLKKQY